MEGDAARLMDLFRTEPSARNDAWHDRLGAAFWPARLGTFTPHYVTNDYTGRHAFRLGRDEQDGGQTPTEPAAVVDYAIENGMGMILWPADAPAPLWEFSLGAVLSYRLYGAAYAPRFWNEPPDAGERETLPQGETALVGAPNAQMLPTLVADAARRVMRDVLGIAEPKVLLLGRPDHGSRLVFGLDPDALGGEAGAARAFSTVAWCVPSCIPLYRVDSMARDGAMRPF